MTELDDNPYAAPTTPLEIAPTGERAFGRGWLIRWVLVFGFNLVAPLGLAAIFTRGAGWLGVAAGIIVMFVVSLQWLCRSKVFQAPILVGAICVGLSQFVLVLHMLTGAFALGVISKFVQVQTPIGGSPSPPAIATIFSGFLVTVLTGGQLLLVALGTGKVLLFIKQAWSNRGR